MQSGKMCFVSRNMDDSNNNLLTGKFSNSSTKTSAILGTTFTVGAKVPRT